MTTAAPASLVGRVVDGRYKVLAHIADGGMGSVFVALDERLDREVALKIMRADLARDRAFVDRFRREARSAARLDHPHVVAVSDQGNDDHYVFLAMELVRGRTLRQVIREEAPLRPRAALDVMDAILQALAAAHEAGLVHRDVKPENVLIGDGVIKVADFGLARAVTTDTVTNDSDILLGTAAYLSPEQVEHGTADKRTDVYAAALLLFEMLTGQKAFPGDSPIQVAYQHVHGSVPAASTLVPSTPTPLDELIMLGARNNPDARPDDAAAYLAVLRSTRANLTDDELDGPPEVRGARASHPPDLAHTARFGDDVHRTLPRPLGVDPEPHGRTTPGVLRRRLVALAVVLVLLAAGTGWLFTAGPLGQVTVPQVAGTARGAAIARLHHADLSASVDEVFSESVAKGTVVATKPTGGGQIRRSSAVVLEVSKGPERYAVPTVTGSTQAAATAAITQAHLVVGEVSESYDDTIAAGEVISSTPTAGTESKPRTPVSLVISQGREPITVPDVTKMSKTDAANTLTGLGFKVTYDPDQFSADIPKGSVISMTPPAGGTAYKGDSFTLVVSKGPEMVSVPNLGGDTTAEATAALESVGLQVKVDRYFGGLLDNVRGQSSSPGTLVPKGSTITISVV